MSNLFFTSDTHFGHANVLKFEPEARPFTTVEEMDEALIERWNAVVGPRDVVWHLGDVSFHGLRTTVDLLKRLNGRKKLVIGNHDYLWNAQRYALLAFEAAHGVVYFRKGTVLSHVPLHPDHKRAAVNIHGHLHSKVVERVVPYWGRYGRWQPTALPDPAYFNVSVERHGLAPVAWETIKENTK